LFVATPQLNQACGANNSFPGGLRANPQACLARTGLHHVLMLRAPPAPRPAAPPAESYPESGPARDRWVLARRGPRPAHDLTRPQAFFVEHERNAEGRVAPGLTVLLTSRECPWRCVMCDLWRGTVPGRVPPGLIPQQLAVALAGADPAVQGGCLKLYNSGSFFDPWAVPPADYPALAAQVTGFGRVVVECHPNLVGRRVLEFQQQLRAAAAARGRPAPGLEVALGLETADPAVLARLNKRVRLEQFRRAADFLRRHGVALRVFILVQPPFAPPGGAVEAAVRSVDFAFECGAAVAVLIPTRPGNGALEALAAAGQFTPPRLATLEAALDRSLRPMRGRVFADLWDLEVFSDCPACFAARRKRLERINHEQRPRPPVRCPHCGAGQKTTQESQETPSRASARG
jgi:radical SAM enzyme (TIGR01210 family)